MRSTVKSKKTVFVGMSGGVDSSVTAYLLKKQGYTVIGVFMRSYNIDGCAEEDAEDARRVAGQLEIPFYTWDFEEEYKRRVVEYMIDGYRKGLTPNPDVMCNREIKFGLFLEKALSMGADYVATGHYVSLKKKGNIISIYEAKDKNKDQSYFLWTLTQKQLKHCIFPIGEYLKSEVRAIAKKAKLSTAEKKDSQGICFLGKVSIAEFLKDYIPEKRGEIITTEGKKIGEHKGATFYTIGQRHGLDLKTKNRELGVRGDVDTKAHYVVSKNVKTNTLIVAEGESHEALYKKELLLTNFSATSSKLSIPKTGLSVVARVRYRQKLSPAQLYRKGKGFILTFKEAQRFVAPGQSAVFYLPRRSFRKTEAGDHSYMLLGGGVIV